MTEKSISLFADCFFPPSPPAPFPTALIDHLHTKAPARGEQDKTRSFSSPGGAKPGDITCPCPCRWESQPSNSFSQKLIVRIYPTTFPHLDRRLFAALQAALPWCPTAAGRISQQNALGPTVLPILLRTTTPKHVRTNPLLLFTLSQGSENVRFLYSHS